MIELKYESYHKTYYIKILIGYNNNNEVKDKPINNNKIK